MEISASLKELTELTLGLEAGRYDPAAAASTRNLRHRLVEAAHGAPTRLSGALSRTAATLETVEVCMPEADPTERRTMSARLAEHYDELIRAIRAQSGRAAGGLARRITRDNPWRSLFHAAGGIGAAVMYRYGVDATGATMIAIGAALVGLFLEATRRLRPNFNTWFMDTPFVRLIARSDERSRIHSSSWFAWGVLVSVLLFSPTAVQVGCIVLAVGDPAAGFIGRRMGGPKLLEAKSVGGSLAFVFLGGGAAWGFLMATSSLGVGTAFAVAFLAAFAGAFAELLSRSIDDNFTIPIAASLAAALVLGL